MRIGAFVMGTRGGDYAAMLDQVERCEQLGFDTVVLAERHFQHAPLLYPSPLAVGAAIAARTERIRIGTAGRILSLDHPVHIAEDAATLDVLSGGRLDFGVTRASLDEDAHHAFSSPHAESRQRFLEALDIIVRAWTEDSFGYEGEHFTVPELAVFPKPLQRPHPPLYVVAVSAEQLAFACRAGLNAYVSAIRTAAELAKTASIYRDGLEAAGNDPAERVLSINRFVYVADDDERAREELEEPFLQLMHHHAPDLKAALVTKYGGVHELTFERFLADFCICGDPETVVRRLQEVTDASGCEYLLATLNFVTLEHALCLRSMELFAGEVMPALRATTAVAPVGER
jgi:alkanesulfonate monooxygenase SsuD/methylene tetrahydromethanopterin reductase-like flavin-dependent oxidoreductase (luciferase family)